jgi:lipoprotein-anchoring transpeptidase ErfK/SrfK
MKYYTSRCFLQLILHFSVTAVTLTACGIASADIRDDALIAVSRLHQRGAALQLPDDMRSLDATLTDAERYNISANRIDADKLYLLTLQKARIIESLLENQPIQPVSPLSHDTLESNPNKEPDNSLPPLTDQEPDSSSVEDYSDKLVGGIGTHIVTSGDSIRLVAARLGVTRQHLTKLNRLDKAPVLKVGQKLIYNNRKIIPKRMRDGIVVNIPDRTLYFFQQGKLVRSLPVALGTSVKNEKYVWQTPVGKFKITAKQKDPTWFVPPSIQSEMEELGKEVISSVAPGPENPLGKFAIKTSIPGILIHSTTKPWSIYSFASHGCIRVYPKDMEGFFNEVRINTPGEIIYKPVKLAVTESGKIFLEVHQDIYKKGANSADEAKKMIEDQNLSKRVNWNKFEAVTTQKSGVAEDITM